MKYKPGHTYKPGDIISGKYHNVNFEGIVRIARRHSIRHDLTEIHIDLINHIEVYKTKRNSIILSILDDGSEL